jgi:hypothetical protein
MNLRIKQMLDRGVSGKERLWMVAEADLDLAFYVVFDTRFEEGGISSGPKHVHWWATHSVKKGDWVILYTGTGASQIQARTDGKTNHFFHWGFPNALWNDKDGCAVLLELTSWETWPDR